MTKKKIERLSVIHRREINWLKWYFLRDKKNPKRTILEQKIIVSHIKTDRLEAKFLSNLKKSTEDFIDKSDPKYLRAIKEVYVYENMNVIGACQKYYFIVRLKPMYYLMRGLTIIFVRLTQNY